MLKSCSCKPPPERVSIDGSSTVYMISEAVAEEYQKRHPGRISLRISGTGGAFKKFCDKRIRLMGASRPINEKEAQVCEKNGVAVSEFAVALDGIVVAVNAKNSWVRKIDVATLKKLFEPEAEEKINYWSDLNPSWPMRKLLIFAPGISSGTYDYFTRVIVGKEHDSRGDITSSEDDNVLVHGVRSNLGSIGFFSFAYYQENKNELKALAVINDEGHAVLPTVESIRNGTYAPLSRAVYLYADQRKASEAEKTFLHFYLENSSRLAHDVGFIALNDEANKENMGKLTR